MAIPDQVIFATNTTFGDVRKLTDDSKKIQILKLRLDDILIRQIGNLAAKENDKLLVNSPYPLTVLTCIACETLGRIIIDTNKHKNEDISRKGSIEVFKKIDSVFSRPMTKTFKKQMQGYWTNEDISSIKNYATIFYKYLRTSFTHGYRAKNVFLNHKLSEGWKIESGYLIINPYWFWSEFVIVYEKEFVKMLDTSEKNNPSRKYALQYLDSLIKK